MVIKICGLRRYEDIEIVNKYKPDYIGFIFAKSKRQVSALFAAELAGRLDSSIKTVGVFVNAPIAEVEETVKTVGLSVVQLHGDEDGEYIKKLNVGCEVWKAVRVRDGADIPDVIGTDRLLLDKYTDKEYGGSGKTFDWSSVGSINTDKPLILAGGLTAQNVKRGIEIFHPWGVDVSSSMETDGFKDEKKIREFIDILRKEEKYE
ncbi:MAG: phosphoribosylanthranilate isomerase [Oscillospiraceae bacterium]|nr:phosphoribosylanthranilate isomerase [Oscillospiraceae bacterium]